MNCTEPSAALGSVKHLRQESRAKSEQRILLMVAFYFPPENQSGALRPFRFVKYLYEHGYSTHVVTASPQPDLTARDWGCAHHVSLGQCDAARTVSGRFAEVVQRLLPYNDQVPWIPNALLTCRNIIGECRPSIVISTSPPIATHLAALFLKRRYGLRWVADFRDPIYGNPFRTRKWGMGYDRLIEGVIMRNADAIIANTDVSAQQLRRRYARYRSKVHLVWNGYDPADNLDFRPVPERPRKILLHAGSVYGGRHPGEILASLERLFNKGLLPKETLQVDLLGTIDMGSPWIQQSRLPDFVREGWVTYSSGTVPQPEARRRIAEADYLLLLDINESGASLQVPAKLFEYIRAGRPILAVTTRNSPAERILRASGVSSDIIYQNDPADLTDGKIARFISSHATTATPSAWFHRTFDTRVQTEYMASLLDQLIRA